MKKFNAVIPILIPILIHLFCLKNVLFNQNSKHIELRKTKYQPMENDVI